MAWGVLAGLGAIYLISRRRGMIRRLPKPTRRDVVCISIQEYEKLRRAYDNLQRIIAERRFGRPRTEAERLARHFARYGEKTLPPRGTGWTRYYRL